MSDDAQILELVRQTHTQVLEIVRVTSTMEATVAGLAKTVGQDHDTLTTISVVMGDLKDSSSATATASIRMADLAEAKEVREAALRLSEERKEIAVVEAQAKNTGRLWSFVENNWKPAVLICLMLAGINVEPVLRYYFGAPAPSAVQVAAPAAPVAAPLPEAPNGP